MVGGEIIKKGKENIGVVVVMVEVEMVVMW